MAERRRFTNALDVYFEKVREQKNLFPAVPFVMGGDPDPGATEDIVTELYREGARLIEIGMPFSDPTADGPVIQEAARRALEEETTLRALFTSVKTVTRFHKEAAIILMGYYNPIRAYGEAAFAKACAGAGVCGVIIVDLPPEHGDNLHFELSAAGVHFIRLIAPNTREERLKELLSLASGCVYNVAVTGVTGGAAAAKSDIAAAVKRVRAISDIPVITGFGVRTGADAAGFTEYADSAVIGSALVDAIAKARDGTAARTAGAFWRRLRREYEACTGAVTDDASSPST